MSQNQVAKRAKILLYKFLGSSVLEIYEPLGINKNKVMLYFSKFKEDGIKRALFDDRCKGRPIEITDDAGA